MAQPRFTQVSGRAMWEQCDHFQTRIEGADGVVCLAVDKHAAVTTEADAEAWLAVMGSAVVVPLPADRAEQGMVLLADPTQGLLALDTSGWAPHQSDLWPWHPGKRPSLRFLEEGLLEATGVPTQIALDPRQRLWVLHPGANRLYLIVNNHLTKRSVQLPAKANASRWAMGCSSWGVVLVSEDLQEHWVLPWQKSKPWQPLLPEGLATEWRLLCLCADPAWERVALLVQTNAGARLMVIDGPGRSAPREFQLPSLHTPVHGLMVGENRWLISDPRYGPEDPRQMPLREFRLEGHSLQGEAGYAVRGFDGRALWRVGERMFASTAKGARELFREEQTLHSTGRVETWALDSTNFACSWHRLFVDCCLPVGSSVRIQAKTSDELPPQKRKRKPRRPVDETQQQNAPWLRENWEQWPPLGSLVAEDDDGWVVLNVPDRRPAHADLPLPPHGIERASEDPLREVRQPNPAPPRGMVTLEWLLSTPPGRYLWLRFTLEGTAKQSPRLHAFRVTYPRPSLLEYLPAYWKDDGEGGKSTEAALALFEGWLSELDGRSQALRLLLQPGLAPAESLPWLADFVALSFDERIGVSVRRQLLSEIMELYRWRGTRPGLSRLLSILAEGPVQIVEGFQLRTPTMGSLADGELGGELEIGGGEGLFDPEEAESWEKDLRDKDFELRQRRQKEVAEKQTPCPEADPAEPLSDNAVIAFYRRRAHRFTVMVPCTENASLKAVLERAIESNKPAHTLHQLHWVDKGYRIGCTSVVGIHALGQIPRAAPAVLGAGVLGVEQTLHKGSEAFTAQTTSRPPQPSHPTRGEAR